MQITEKLTFKTGFSKSIDVAPVEWYAATVPGAVQLDWEKAKSMEPYWKGENFRNYAFTEDMFWFYKSEITIKEDPFLIPMLFFKCVDYECCVRINKTEIFQHEGLSGFQIDLSAYRGQTCNLEVIVFPAPKNQNGSVATNSCKPAVSFGWDFHPRLVPMGICDECGLLYLHSSNIETVFINTSLNENLDIAVFDVKANISLADISLADIRLADINKAGGELVLTITGPDKKQITKSVNTKSVNACQTINFCVEIKDPLLWWCAGHGEQNLYIVELALVLDGIVTDTYTCRTGLRRIKLVPNKDTWIKEPFPATQCIFPITIELNGRCIFARGSNWVPPDIFPGLTTRETYLSLLTLCREANMNMLRCWGGGPVNKDSFYELCDEMGIMVWQEFPLCCNYYSEKQQYLSLLDKESRSIITRLRNHPCITIWCGGNELFYPSSQMTNQSPALRLLDKNCYELNPQVPYLMTSPIYGMAHGHYVLFDGERETVSAFVESRKSAYTEFGCPSASPISFLKTFMTDEEFNQFGKAGVWKAHHAYEAWAYPQTWFRINDAEKFYGPQQDFEKLIEASLRLQAQGYKHLFEEARRQWPYCSMALNWCFNEPWPSAAGNNIINWPCKPKPAYNEVKSSLRPQMLSLRFTKLLWSCHETMHVDVFALNDAPEILSGSEAEVYICSENSEIPVETLTFNDVEGCGNVNMGSVSIPLKNCSGSTVKIGVRVKNRPFLDSVYELSLLGK